MADVIATRHVAFEHLGILEPALRARGHTVAYVDAGGTPLPETLADEATLLAMLGGPIGAYEDHLYPFLRDELALIEQRLASGKPLLGICLGAQLIARALGARVYPGPRKEIGWAPVTLTADGESSPLRHLEGCGYRVLHWHGDILDLPDGAVRLASTEATYNQAFSLGEAVLGLQFHIEADPGDIERWLVGHACEIAATDGVTVQAIRDDTAAYGSSVAACGAKVFEDWLDRAGL